MARKSPSLPSSHRGGHYILVVDDDRDIREALQSILEEEGYRTATACNGQEALERAREQRPAMILLDLFMPRMDGLRFLRRRREVPELTAIPVFVISAADDARERVGGLEVAGFLDKPIDVGLMLKVVARFCGRS